MQIDILTLFPEMFNGPFDESIIKRAQKSKLVKINLHNLRDWATDKHKKVDDTPYGGGAGMVLKVDVIDRALHDLKTLNSKLETRNKSQFSKFKIQKNSDLGFRVSDFQNQSPHVVLLTPQGKTFSQQIAQKLSKKKRLILVCGHYEGFDERIRKLVDEEISIGQYVLTGGEIPAMVIADAVTRLLPGVLGKDESSQEESFSMDKLVDNNLKLKIKNSRLGARQVKLQTKGLLEYPQYTRPENYTPISKNFKRSLSVPKILLSGNHAKIKNWRVKQSLKKSKK